MSLQITTAQVQQYSTNVQMLLQQKQSKFRMACDVQAGLRGKGAAIVEQFGAVTTQRDLPRHADTPLVSVPQDRRWVYPHDHEWAELIDDQDKLRLIIDPTSPYVQAGVAAFNRAMDDEFLLGFFGSNMTGELGTSATGLLSAYNSGSQVVGATVGSTGNTGMNVAKLRAAKRKLIEAEVDVDTEQLYVAISGKQHDDLLAETQLINLDYNTRPVLVDGRITSFMGFNFILSERIPGAAGFNTDIGSSITGYTTGTTWLNPFWAKSGMCLGLWEDLSVTVDKRPDKRNAMQPYIKGTLGATRKQEKLCGIITCY